MSDFTLWFTEGLWHIADIRAYDHILFLIVLFGGLQNGEWKKALLLITAFTVGHSITLALSVLSVLKIKIALVEFLIPCTILATAIYNLASLKVEKNRGLMMPTLMTLFFGLIHGLGFSVLLRSMLGKTQSIIGPLFSFNLGIEGGQLMVVTMIVLITMILTKLLKISTYHWRFFLSAAAFGIAFVMALERV